MSEKNEDDLSRIASERGRSSAAEGTKLLITISMTSLGVFFVTLTREIKPELTNPQKTIAIMAVSLMGIASACGILSWWIDAKAHINWALARTQKDKKIRSKHYKLRDKWKRFEKINNRVFFVAFPFGILSAIAFIILRILVR